MPRTPALPAARPAGRDTRSLLTDSNLFNPDAPTWGYKERQNHDTTRRPRETTTLAARPLRRSWLRPRPIAVRVARKTQRRPRTGMDTCSWSARGLTVAVSPRSRQRYRRRFHTPRSRASSGAQRPSQSQTTITTTAPHRHHDSNHGTKSHPTNRRRIRTQAEQFPTTHPDRQRPRAVLLRRERHASGGDR